MDLNEPDTRIPFGPGPTETIPAEWATTMLTQLKHDYPAIFGDLLQQALGIEPRRRRRANGQH